MEEMVADLVSKLVELPEEVLVEVIRTIALEKEIDLMALATPEEVPVEGEEDMAPTDEEEVAGPSFGPQNFM